MSLGTDRVRADFNPSKDTLVNTIKTRTAELIDLCNPEHPQGHEEARLWLLARQQYEDAAMWATKAATYGK